MALTEVEIQEAIGKVMEDCDRRMAKYEMVSLRSSLTSLGYNHDQTVDVIFYVAEKGFTYCLDNIVICSNGLMATQHRKEFPVSKCVTGVRIS